MERARINLLRIMVTLLLLQRTQSGNLTLKAHQRKGREYDYSLSTLPEGASLVNIVFDIYRWHHY